MASALYTTSAADMREHVRNVAATARVGDIFSGDAETVQALGEALAARGLALYMLGSGRAVVRRPSPPIAGVER